MRSGLFLKQFDDDYKVNSSKTDIFANNSRNRHIKEGYFNVNKIEELIEINYRILNLKLKIKNVIKNLITYLYILTYIR